MKAPGINFDQQYTNCRATSKVRNFWVVMERLINAFGCAEMAA